MRLFITEMGFCRIRRVCENVYVEFTHIISFLSCQSLTTDSNSKIKGHIFSNPNIDLLQPCLT
jgi:hypothetical protein